MMDVASAQAASSFFVYYPLGAFLKIFCLGEK